MFETELGAMQDLYNTVRAHLLCQGAKSQEPSSMANCRYRGDGGLSCAIGCLIPDDKYDLDMEGGLIELIRKYPDVLPTKYTSWITGYGKELTGKSDLIRSTLLAQQDMLGLMVALQGIHDHIAVTNWPSQLVNIALKYNLDPGEAAYEPGMDICD